MKKYYMLLLLVSLLWGFNVPALKVLVTNIDPLLLTSFRILTSGIAVLAASYFLKIFRLPSRKELLIILYITTFNVVLHHLGMAFGLKYTSGVNAGLIIGTGPLFTMILSVIFMNKRFTLYTGVGFILGFTGVVITTLAGTNGVNTISIGDLFVLVGIIVQSFSFILISKLNPSFDPRLLTGYMLTVGSVFIFIINLFSNSDFTQIYNLFNWKLGSVFLFSALFCTALSHMIYNYATKNLGPSESAIFINFTTFFAIVGAAIFLKESILYHHIMGLVLVILGVLLGAGAVEYIVGMKKRRSTITG